MKRYSPRPTLTLMVMTEKREPRFFRLSSIVVRWSLLASGVLLLGLTLWIARYFYLESEVRKLAGVKQMQEQFDTLKQDLLDEMKKFHALQEKVRKLEDRLKSKSYAPPREDTEMQAFPVLEESTFSPDGMEDALQAYKLLTSRREKLESQYVALNEEVSRRLSLLEYMPSIPPTSTLSISSGFGYRRNPLSGRKDFHPGLDIRGDPSDVVRATASGTVIFAGWKGGYGRTVIIDHGNGFVTWFAHNYSLTVRSGERVKKGQVIARIGSSGYTTGPHLHYEVHYRDKIIDPRIVLNVNVFTVESILSRVRR